MMHVLLEMWGYSAVEADGYDETINLAEAHAPHAIIVDTSRSYEEDLAIVAGLRRSGLPAVPVIVMSSYNRPDLERSAFESGATSVMAKPLDVELLQRYLASSLSI
jgi:CheY-like chemotaxis protein